MDGAFLLPLRGIRYGVFAGVGVLARHTRHLHYAPLLALFFFGVSLVISHGGTAPVPKRRYPFAAALTVTPLAGGTRPVSAHLVITQIGS